LSAKVFGGARIVATSRETGTRDIAAENVATAERSLAALAIPIAARDVGGTHARKIIFSIADGVVRVKVI
jgi:chemotaxis protein CheD